MRACRRALASHALRRGVATPCQTMQLIAPGEVWLGPSLDLDIEPSRRMQRPIGIGQMWPRQAAQVGASGHEDGIDVVRLVDVADGDGGHARLVADAVREGRLEHAAIHGTCGLRRLARRYID